MPYIETEPLEILENNRAQVAIRMGGREVALRNPNEVEQATRRLAERNIEEGIATLNGTLIGMVPTRGVFEFRTTDSDETLQGRIGQEVHEPYRVAARYTSREVRARIRRVRVGQGQPKYSLVEILGPADGPTSL